jgi:hypothetical protein
MGGWRFSPLEDEGGGFAAISNSLLDVAAALRGGEATPGSLRLRT